MNCIIVDDEPMAIKVIESHIQHIDNLNIVGKYNSAISAFSALQTLSVDLIFLDIQMPKMSGLTFIKAINQSPYIVLTTAHREYALESYELNVTDYLLKPISFERFMKAMSKIYALEQKQMLTTSAAEVKTTTSKPFVYVKSERQFIKILLEDILYIESIKNHVVISTKEKKTTTLLSISQMEAKLPEQHFIRIHRSFIVNMNSIQQFSSTHIMVEKKHLPIGRLYKNEVLKRLQDDII